MSHSEETRLYLIHIRGSSPILRGPFDSESDRLEKAENLRAESKHNGLFRLDITPSGDVEVGSMGLVDDDDLGDDDDE